MPSGLNTILGEKGIKISGGQRQRIAIARELFKDPQLLIFDEATSSLDNRTERMIQDAIEVASKGRTTIVIAHRLSTIRNADKIIVLSNGIVYEEGLHNNLIQIKNGIYANLWNIQTGRRGDLKINQE